MQLITFNIYYYFILHIVETLNYEISRHLNLMQPVVSDKKYIEEASDDDICIDDDATSDDEKEEVDDTR